MRVLCLHGMGTSGRIWEAQTVGLRALLPQDWQYTFIDGEEECDPAEGIDAVYEGPYFTFYTLPTFEAVEDCHGLLDDVIEESGPFDAVMGFSQGGALAASYLLHRGEAFSLAIFVNSSLPYSTDPAHGISMATLFSSMGATGEAWKAVVPSDNGQLKVLNTSIQQANQDGIVENIRRWHPSHDQPRIGIDTVHVYGAEDEYLAQSMLLRDLCNPATSLSFQHSGGHEVPRDKNACRTIAGMILKAKARAEFRQ